MPADSHRVPAVGQRADRGRAVRHGLRREEAALLMVGDIQERRGIRHLQIHSKGGKLRYLPLHPVTASASMRTWSDQDITCLN